MATTPKSENIIVLSAPASSIARISLLKATPVALHADTFIFLCLNRLIKEQAATVFPESIHVPEIAITGIFEIFKIAFFSYACNPALAGTPILSPRKGKLKTVPKSSQLNGGPTSGL